MKYVILTLMLMILMFIMGYSTGWAFHPDPKIITEPCPTKLKYYNEEPFILKDHLNKEAL